MELGQGGRSCLMELFPVPQTSSMPGTYDTVAAFLGRAWSTSHCMQTIELRPAICSTHAGWLQVNEDYFTIIAQVLCKGS